VLSHTLAAADQQEKLLNPRYQTILLDIWNQENGGPAAARASRELLDARQNPAAAAHRHGRAARPVVQARYTPTAQNKIYGSSTASPTRPGHVRVPAPAGTEIGAGAR